MAKRIVTAFGQETFEIIEASPACLMTGFVVPDPSYCNLCGRPV